MATNPHDLRVTLERRGLVQTGTGLAESGLAESGLTGSGLPAGT